MGNSAVVGILRALLTANTAEFDAAMKRSSASAKAWSKDLGQIGRQATTLGASLTKTLTLPIVGLATASAKAAIDFESSFAGVRKTVKATDEEFAALAQGMRNLSKTIPINVNELNKIGESAGQLGIKAENILGFTEVMAKLGVTTNLAGEEAAMLLARFDNITTGGAQRTFEELGATIVGLGNNLVTTEAEIGAIALRLAGAGTQIGLTQADILSLGGALSSLGLEAEAGGTAFSRVMIEMQNAVLDGGKNLQLFNSIVQDDFARLFKEDAALAINGFIAGLARMGEEGKNINPVLDELGLGGLRVSDALRRTGNAVERVSEAVALGREEWRAMSALNDEAAERFKTTASQLTILWQRVKDVGITLGNALLPTIKSAIAGATLLIPVVDKLAQGFADLPGPIQLGVLGVAGLAAAIPPLIYLFGQLALAGSSIVAAFQKGGLAMRAVTLTMSGVSTATSAVGSALSSIVSVGGGTVGVVSRIGAAMAGLSVPILAIVGAAAGMVAWLVRWTDLGPMARQTTGRLVDVLRELAGLMQDTLGAAFRLTTEAAEALMGVLGDFVVSIFPDLAATWRALRDSGLSTVEALGLMTTALQDLIQPVAAAKTAFKLFDVGLILIEARIKAMREELGLLLALLLGPSVPDVKSPFQAPVDGPIDFDEAAARTEALRGAVARVATSITVAGEEAEKAQKRIKALVQSLSGAETQRQIQDTAAAWKRLIDQGIRPSAAVQAELAEKIQQWRAEGRQIPPVLLEQNQALQRLTTTINFHNTSLAGAFTAWDAFSKKLIDSRESVLIPMSEKVQQLSDRWGEFASRIRATNDTIAGLPEPDKWAWFKQMDTAFDRMKDKASALQQAFAKLPGVIMGALQGGGDVVKSIGGSLGGDLFGKFAGKLNAETGLFGGGIGEFLQKTLGKTIGGALGSIIPGIGTLIGSSIGGLVDKLFGSKGRDAVKDFAASFGGFDALRKQMLTLENGGEQLWIKLTQGVGRNNPKEAEAAIKAITDAFAKQAAELDKLKTTLAGDGIWDAWTRNAAAAALATGEDLIGMAEAVERQQGRLAGGLQGLTSAVAGSQDEFDRLGRIALNAFNTLIGSGVSSGQAISMIGPSIDSLIAQLDTMGFSSSEAFDSLRRWAGLVEANQPLINQIAGLNQLLIATANLGGLTEEAFDDLEAQGRQAFKSLLAAGFTEQEALAEMAPMLQTLIQLHKDRGLTIDDETQKLIDQAREQGLLKDEEISTNDILMQGLGKLIELLGGEVPAAWRDMARGAKDAVNDVVDSVDDLGKSIRNLPGLPTRQMQFEEGGDDGRGTFMAPELGVGGIVTRRMPAIVGEAGPEAVIPLDQLPGLIQKMSGAAGGSDRPIVIENYIYLDGEQLTESTFRRIETNNSGGAPVSLQTRFGSLVRQLG